MPHIFCAAFFYYINMCNGRVGKYMALIFRVALVSAVVLNTSCSMQGVVGKNKYVLTPVTDTLVVLLPGCDNEFCRIKVYGNSANFMASDYVADGCVRFCVSSLPAGRHRVLVRVGNILADEVIVKK